MRRLLWACAFILLSAAAASAQGNCIVVNGVSQCASPWRIYDSTVRAISFPILDLSQTWNAPGVTFTGLKQNVTDTNSATASLLLDLQVGGTSKFSVAKSGAFASTFVSLGTTSTDGFTLSTSTAANATTTVQISPRLKWCGTAWNSSSSASETDCFFAEVLPATVAGTTTATWKLGTTIAGGAATYPLTVTNAGVVTTLSSAVVGGNIQFAANGSVGPTGRAAFSSTADKLSQFMDNGFTTGIELNAGSATLGTCTGGTITTGSHNQAGGYTGNTSGSCVVNFGTPNWTNAPFCLAASIASTTHPRVSAASTSSITITGGVSGEAITYVCFGRIGT